MLFARGGGRNGLLGENNINCPTPVDMHMACRLGKRWLFRMIE